MKKLLNLKHWLTVPDAARHLSMFFGEDVSEADILRLALDGHLTLSVNFVNHTTGRCGPVVPPRTLIGGRPNCLTTSGGAQSPRCGSLKISQLS